MIWILFDQSYLVPFTEENVGEHNGELSRCAVCSRLKWHVSIKIKDKQQHEF
jgi:hypothetical protein